MHIFHCETEYMHRKMVSFVIDQKRDCFSLDMLNTMFTI